jgi:hypothetical protein
MRCYANRYGTKLLATLASTTTVDASAEVVSTGGFTLAAS